MSQNKNALIRYKTIDKCLQNKYRQWTLEDLIEACSEALYEYEGRKNPISKRTIQLDIQIMRSEKLGYNAPIEVYDKKFYRYEDEYFTITDIPITETDMNVLNETITVLKQFKDFSLFKDVADIMQRLEDKIYSEQQHTKPIIYLDKNKQLRGLKFLDELYQAIVKKVVLVLDYKSFKASESRKLFFHAYWLKEFNNRWFLVGKESFTKPIIHLALDRIVSIEYDFQKTYIEDVTEAETYYKNVVGVTVNNLDAKNIELWIDKQNAPYVLTKPMHHSQQLIQENEDGSIIISLKLIINQEFERMIMGFAEGLKVIKPNKLKEQMKARFEKCMSLYVEV